MKRREISAGQAKQSISDGDWFKMSTIPGWHPAIVVAAMGSSHHGLDIGKVREHNAQMLALKPHADIGLCNIRRADDPSRIEYTRECWLRNGYEGCAQDLCDRLNEYELDNGHTHNEEVWRVRTEGEWTIVFAGDPVHSAKKSNGAPLWSLVGGLNKTEHLVTILVGLLRL
jgi:hypothetical protein